MAIALHPDDITEYVSKDDRELPAEQRTVFLLRPIPAIAFARLTRKLEAMNSGNDPELLAQAIEATLKAGLCGWRNFRRATGDEVEFASEAGVATDTTLAALPFRLAEELFVAILAENKVGGTSAGN